MVKDNPSYFYSVLPFAYILGVSDVWIKQFEDIMNQIPEYEGHYINAYSFDRFANSFKSCTLPSYENGGITRSSSSGGGGFSTGLNLVKLASSNLNVEGGYEEAKCDKILKEYFEKIRNEKDT